MNQMSQLSQMMIINLDDVPYCSEIDVLPSDNDDIILSSNDHCEDYKSNEEDCDDLSLQSCHDSDVSILDNNSNNEDHVHLSMLSVMNQMYTYQLLLLQIMKMFKFQLHLSLLEITLIST